MRLDAPIYCEKVAPGAAAARRPLDEDAAVALAGRAVDADRAALVLDTVVPDRLGFLVHFTSRPAPGTEVLDGEASAFVDHNACVTRLTW